jgi:hypothetical protein
MIKKNDARKTLHQFWYDMLESVRSCCATVIITSMTFEIDLNDKINRIVLISKNGIKTTVK